MKSFCNFWFVTLQSIELIVFIKLWTFFWCIDNPNDVHDLKSQISHFFGEVVVDFIWVSKLDLLWNFWSQFMQKKGLGFLRFFLSWTSAICLIRLFFDKNSFLQYWHGTFAKKSRFDLVLQFKLVCIWVENSSISWKLPPQVRQEITFFKCCSEISLISNVGFNPLKKGFKNCFFLFWLWWSLTFDTVCSVSISGFEKSFEDFEVATCFWLEEFSLGSGVSTRDLLIEISSE